MCVGKPPLPPLTPHCLPRGAMGGSLPPTPAPINPMPPAVDGHWSEWSAWTRCSRPGFTSRINCQEIIGQQKRTRVCEGRAHNGQRCPGSTTQEIRFCYNMQLCSCELGVGTRPEPRVDGPREELGLRLGEMGLVGQEA